MKIANENLVIQKHQLSSFENTQSDALVNWIDHCDDDDVVVVNNSKKIKMVRGTEKVSNDCLNETRFNKRFNIYDVEQAATVIPFFWQNNHDFATNSKKGAVKKLKKKTAIETL